MAKTLFENGTPLTPELLNKLINPVFVSDPKNDGELPYPPAAAIGPKTITAEKMADSSVEGRCLVLDGTLGDTPVIMALQDGRMLSLTLELLSALLPGLVTGTELDHRMVVEVDTREHADGQLQALIDGEISARNSAGQAFSTAIETLNDRVFPNFERLEVSDNFTPIPNLVYEISRNLESKPAVIEIATANMADGESFLVVGRGSNLDVAITFSWAWGGNPIIVPFAPGATSHSVRLTRYGSGYIFE